ncbi:MAG: CBS domain-containing protein [Desulfobacteraceae bacterium]|nr:CBS domain-containing protein [Desulfobacteraceae bacterium]
MKKELTVITTHINADFDAMASMLAAQKLYPGSLVVFPGSHEKTLRNFFVHSMVYLFNMADMKDIEFSDIKRLVLVDTRQPARIGKFSSLLEKQDLEIHIYDHHPVAPDDIKGHYEVFKPTGATVTILTEIIKQKQISISPDEATIMCLGIYEDTGSFTFTSTTENDLNAAAFFLSKGADLSIISNLIAREMSLDQVEILNDMLQAAVRYNIKGVEIVITSIIADYYVPDFAFLVHKMIRMENLNAIFAIAQMGSKVYIVARSRSSDVDVGSIVGILGGGGHAFAASVSVKGKTLAQTEHELIEILNKKIVSSKRAKDLMSSPAIKAAPDISCEEARNLLTRYNINALLVTENISGKDKLLGYITRQILSKAVFLKLSHSSVREYMTTEIGFVGLDSELSEIQEKIIENKQRVLPVIDTNGDIKGVVTRTDLLNTLVQQYTGHNLPDPHKEEINARSRIITRFMRERLPEHIIDLLKTIGHTAADLGYDAYVVGGFVRDLFMFRKNEDIDIVIEGNGIRFAKKIASMMSARIHSHEKFCTAVIIFSDGFKIDVASARMEHYRFPADLPTVEMSSIKLDLFRRDFTVNTLAIQLNPDKFGTLIDFFSAQKDIKKKAIRILHNLSFVEDPTRVFRAIRFEQRFGFSIGKLTSGLIHNVVKMDFFRQLSGRRLFTELRLILEEENPTPAIKRLHDYNLLTVIHPSVKPTKKLILSFDSVKKVLSWYDLLFLKESYMRWSVYFMMLIRQCDIKGSEEICEKLELAPRYRSIFCRERFEADQTLFWLKNNMPFENSVLYKKLCGFRIEIILYMMAAARYVRIKEAISNYFTQLRHVTTSVRGEDLKKMGLPPGPVYREILDAVLCAKLNGKVKTRNDELNFVRNYVS